jgi:hypothetical protein
MRLRNIKDAETKIVKSKYIISNPLIHKGLSKNILINSSFRVAKRCLSICNGKWRKKWTNYKNRSG